jgi:hypothetical protein
MNNGKFHPELELLESGYVPISPALFTICFRTFTKESTCQRCLGYRSKQMGISEMYSATGEGFTVSQLRDK